MLEISRTRDLQYGIWLSDTLQSLNRGLAERRREDPYESWLMIETVETSERLEWKAIHFVAFRKLNIDTSATISELPFSSLSLWVGKKESRMMTEIAYPATAQITKREMR